MNTKMEPLREVKPVELFGDELPIKPADTDCPISRKREAKVEEKKRKQSKKVAEEAWATEQLSTAEKLVGSMNEALTKDH